MEMKPEIKTETECARFGGKGKSFKVHAADQGQSLQARPASPCGTVGGPVVKVVGTLDPKTNTITVEKMEAKSQRGSTPKSNECSCCESRDKAPAGLKCDH